MSNLPHSGAICINTIKIFVPLHSDSMCAQMTPLCINYYNTHLAFCGEMHNLQHSIRSEVENFFLFFGSFYSCCTCMNQVLSNATETFLIVEVKLTASQQDNLLRISLLFDTLN